MKQFILTLVSLLFVTSIPANAYDFSAVNDDGVTIYYNILSSSNRTCEVTYLSSNYKYNYHSENVVIPDAVEYNGKTYSVTAIGSSAFENCHELTSVTIPESVTTIKSCAFYQSGLTGELIIPNSVTGIGNGAFFCCMGLTEVTIPNSVTAIGDELFMYCSGLTSVTIPESVTRIGDSAFFECTGLAGELIIPNSVTRIYDSAFYGCRRLTSVTIGNSVTSIGKEAFCGCSGLTGTLIIPNGVTSIGSWAFEGCSGLTGELVIPNGVTSIGSWAFEECSGLTEVTIPNSVTSIGDYAFDCCYGLTSLTIGNSVETIGTYAFSSSSRLKRIYSLNPQPPTCSSHGYGVFDNVDKSKCTLYVPEGAKGVYSTADQWKNFLNIMEKNFNFFEVDGIYYNVASSSDQICEVTYKDSSYNSYSGAVTIPETVTQNGTTYTVTSIGNYAFWNCSGLTGVTLPNSIVTIGDEAFSGCSGVTEITIPEQVIEIGGYAFDGCTSLKTVNFNSIACTSAGTTLQSESENRRIYVNRPIFRECSNLSQTTIGNDVISLPDYLFNVCTGLECITSLNPEPPTCGSSVFYNVDTSTCVLYVPEGTLEAYATADAWKDFLYIVDNQPNAIEDIVNGNSKGNGGIVGYYTLDGKKVSQPQRGINAIRYSDGTVRKVLTK